jgi:lysyl-tRNA synthetase class 2
LKYLDAGDFIGVKGYMFRTHKGELTLMVEDAELLTKSIAPLPEKWHGLKDVETRYRQRYVDLIINPEVKKVFEMRSKIIRLVRKFLDERGFLEVETPLMQPVYGGANARPFVTYANAWDTHLYMSISPELYLKRLVVGGYEKVYTICKNFRNEDVDKTHNPEFTMIEAYAAYVDYNYWMEMTEDLYVYIAKELFGSTKFDYCGTEIDVKKPWKRYTMEQALKELAGKDVEKMPDAQIQKLLAENEIEVEGGYNRGLAINELFGRLCEPKLIQPVFIIDPPRETCPLAKQHRKNPKLIERFEPFIMGWEVANAYSELNDPAIQKEEFEKQEESRKKKSLEHIHPADFDYVNALEYGMPPTGGWGMGIDRLVMLFTGSATIKDVIFFPQMRPEHAGTGVKDLKELSGAGKKK